MNHDQLSGGLFFVLGCAICLHSLQYRLGTLAAPESGLMPFLSGAAIALLAALGFLLGTLRRLRGEGWRPLFRGVAWRRGLLQTRLGFTLTTVLFIGFLLRAIFPQRWSVVIVTAVLTAVIAYLVFEVWLQAQLPMGPFGI
ncbi:MAG: tripartite tricarboxylate transporter TctB family protein [Candidatus Methylomirabilota bacterium]